MAEITPVDVQNKQFRRSFRGYHPSEVDEFLDTATKTLDGLIRENEALKEQVGELSERVEQYRGIEDTLQHTLVIAQETADEVRVNARKEAQLILAEARAEAERVKDRSERDLRDIRGRAEDIRAQMLEYVSRSLANTQAQMEILRTAQTELDASSRTSRREESEVEPESGSRREDWEGERDDD